MTSPWPVPVHVHSKATSSGTVVWRMDGVDRVTVILKGTFRLAPATGPAAQPATPIEPEPVLAADRVREGSASLERAGETAPYLPSAGVLLTGHACAPGGHPVPSLAVRLAVYRGSQRLMDKVLHVHGDRASASQSPIPFDRMPIVYDRALGGPQTPTNPAGAGAGGRLPNVVSPAHPDRPAGFGPIARHWAPRAYLRPRDQTPDGQAPQLRTGIDFRYYHAAPLDQQIAYLRGDEQILLEGLHPRHPKVWCALPNVRATARVVRTGPGGAEAVQPIELLADTLFIDADTLTASVLFRGSFALASGESPASVRVEGSLSCDATPAPAPEAAPGHAAPPAGARPPVTAPGPVVITSGGSMRSLRATIDPIESAGRKPAAPFAISAPSQEPGPRQQPIAGAPWSGDLAPRQMPVFDRGLRETQVAHTAGPVFDKGLRDTQLAPEGSAPGAGSKDARAARLAFGGTSEDARASSAPSLPFVPGAPDPAIAQPSLAPGRTKSALGTGTLEPPRSAASAPILPFPGAAAPPPPVQPPSEVTRPASQVPPPPLMDAPLPPSVPPSLAPSAPPPLAPSAPPPLAPSAPPPLAPSAEAAPPPPEPAAPPPAAPPAAAQEAPKGIRGAVLARLAANQSLRDLHLAGANLEGIDFGAVALERQDLSGASLGGCNLAGAGLSQANLAGADLTGADLSNAQLAGAVLTRATLARTVLSGANLEGAGLTSVNASQASFDKASLVRADMRLGRFLECAFAGARLDDAVMAKADVSRSRFDGASLARVSLRGARAREAVFARAGFAGADLRDADLSRSNLHDVDLAAAKTAGANMSGVIHTPPAPGKD